MRTVTISLFAPRDHHSSSPTDRIPMPFRVFALWLFRVLFGRRRALPIAGPFWWLEGRWRDIRNTEEFGQDDDDLSAWATASASHRSGIGMAYTLTTTQKAQYREQGYVMLRAIIPQPGIEALKAGLRDLVEASARGDGPDIPWINREERLPERLGQLLRPHWIRPSFIS